MNKLFTKIATAMVGIAMAVGVGVAVGSNSKEASKIEAAYSGSNPYSITLVSGTNGASGTVRWQQSSTSLANSPSDGVTWTPSVTWNGTTSWTNNNFHTQIGAGSGKYAKKVTLTTSDIPGIISSVEVYCASYQSNHSIAISVGATPYAVTGGASTPAWNSTSVSDSKTATGSSSGTLEITFTGNSSARALYVKQIIVNFSNKLNTPSPVYNNSTKQVTWSPVSNASSYQVKVDNGSYATATSPYDVSGLSTDTQHTVYVVAKASGYTDSDAGSVEFTPTAPRTVTGLSVLDYEAHELSNGDEISLTATGESVSTDITCGVTYSSGDPDGAVTITSSPSTGFDVTTEDDETYTLSFTANGDYDVTIAATADDNYSITVTYSVSGIQVEEYELYTGAITAGDYVIVDTGNDHCPGTTVSSNRIDNVDAPTITNNKITKPSASLVWHIAASGTYWTIQNSSTEEYLGATTTKNQGALMSEIDDHAKWSLTYSDSKWVIENLGRSNDSDTPANHYLRNNDTYGWAAYSSGQGTGPSLYKKVSNDPYIEVAVTTGSTSLSVNGTATLTATVKNTTGTVAWSLVDNTPTGTGNVAQISADGNSVTVTGKKDGTVKVRAALTGCDNVDTLITVTKALSSIAVTTAPTKTTYTEGESFSPTGMVVTATYDDGSTTTPNDYTYSPTGALTPSDTTITISYGGKSTTQAITINTKVVSGIAVQTLPTKKSYRSGESFESAGLVIRVTYEGGSTADITSGFTISPDTYTFTDADETAGSKTFTVSYGGKSTTFNVTVAGITGPIASGRYYIMNSTKTHGLNAVAASSSPSALDLSSSDNNMTAFDVTLKADNEYEISVTINDTKYYLVCNTTSTSSSNTSIRVTSSPIALKSLYWNLEDPADETEGAYTVKENTTGTTYRYLACYNTSDWRGYLGASGDRDIQFVAERSYAETIANSLMNDITCNGGSTAPSTSTWGSISTEYGKIPAAMKHEKELLTGGTADEESEDVIEQSLARYDFIVGKYNKGLGITAYNDFLVRDPSPIGSYRPVLEMLSENQGDVSIIIVVISLISLTAIGGYFLLRKKREQ